MIGRRYGRLVVTGPDPTNKNRVACLCDCGEPSIVWKSSLYSGNTSSCGCLHSERTAAANTSRTKHGMSRSPERGVWRAMIQRCTDQSCRAYPHYGGRGISVCAAWMSSFEAFYRDMGPRPFGMELDRENNDGNYEPSNCRWATKGENKMNRRVTVRITCDGVTKTAAEWSAETGIKLATIYARRKAGWSDERIIKEPV